MYSDECLNSNWNLSASTSMYLYVAIDWVHNLGVTEWLGLNCFRFVWLWLYYLSALSSTYFRDFVYHLLYLRCRFSRSLLLLSWLVFFGLEYLRFLYIFKKLFCYPSIGRTYIRLMVFVCFLILVYVLLL